MKDADELAMIIAKVIAYGIKAIDIYIWLMLSLPTRTVMDSLMLGFLASCLHMSIEHTIASPFVAGFICVCVYTYLTRATVHESKQAERPPIDKVLAFAEDRVSSKIQSAMAHLERDLITLLVSSIHTLRKLSRYGFHYRNLRIMAVNGLFPRISRLVYQVTRGKTNLLGKTRSTPVRR